MKLNIRNYQAGIDLGTTNSAIAIVEQNGVKILEAESNEVLLPSCVYFHTKDGYLTGITAKNQRIYDSKNGHKSFKKEMGANTPFPIDILGTNFLAEELSGIILNKMGQVYKQFADEPLHTVVVTVPARFDLKATHATQVAAMGNYRLNGHSRIKPEKLSKYYASFLKVEILMEPIAASLAYGMSKKTTENGSWLVFDFGGGTFDAAIVNYVDGNMDVKHNAGNNHLGGDDLDNKILRYMLEKLTSKYDLAGFLNEEGNDKFRTIRNYLLDEIEKIKIILSKVNEAVITMPNNFKDNNGVKVTDDFKITREEFNHQVEPIFQQAIDICLNLFDEHNIEPGDLDKVLLVGGPTQIPHFREMIKNRLKIELDTSIDPMTAVATGAALYSQIKELPDEVKPEIISLLNQTPTDCRVEIYCENKTLETSMDITGKVIPSDRNYQSVDSISITRADKGWESANIKTDKDGSFNVKIHLHESEYNIFHITVHGKNGRIFTVASAEFSVLQGAGNITDHTPFSLNITIEGGKCVTIIPKDSEFPASNTKLFYTVREIKKGKNTDEGTLYVELTEGESENPENNNYLGTLKIPNAELTRNLPQDTELEVTVSAKSGRTIFAECLIPYTGQTFPAEIKIARTGIAKEKLIEDFETMKTQSKEIEAELESMGDSKWNDIFRKQNIIKDAEGIETLIDMEIRTPKVGEVAFAGMLMKARNLLTETNLKLERFENQVIFDLTKHKIEVIKKNISDLDSPVAEKLFDLEEQLEYCTEQKLTDEAKSIKTSLTRYEKDYMAVDFLYHLQGFILTKQNLFAGELNSLQNAIREASRYDLQFTMISMISDWNREINSKNGCIRLSKYYGRLDYELQNIIDKTEIQDTFTIADYDKLAAVWNKHADYDLSVLEGIAAIKYPSKPLLKSAIAFCKAYPEGKIDKLDKLLFKFTDLYFIDQSVRGDISSSGLDFGNGPGIKDR